MPRHYVLHKASTHLFRVFLLVAATCVAVIATSSPARAVDEWAFIEMAGAGAKPSQEAYGIPPSVTVAQAILESGWGQSNLATTANNYFGKKCHGGDPGPIAVGCGEYPTWECNSGGCYNTTAWFRMYNSIEDSFRDHGRHLYESPRYGNAFNYPTDPDQFIREVHWAGYATDPAYSDKVIGLMQRYDLYRFN